MTKKTIELDVYKLRRILCRHYDLPLQPYITTLTIEKNPNLHHKGDEEYKNYTIKIVSK